MKKFLLVPTIVVLLASLIFVGCAAPTQTPVPTQTPAPTQVPITTPTSAPKPTQTSLPTSATAPSKPIELKIALGSPPGHPVTITFEQWSKDIEKATSGRVKSKMYIGGSILTEAQLYDGILTGIADVGQFLPAFTPGRFNVLEAFELPGNGPGSGKSGSIALWEAYKKLKPAEYSGVKLLWSASSGSAHIGTVKKPIRTLEDIKGLEIRGSGITKDAVDALGGVGVALPMPEVYIALQKGIVKGGAATFETIKSERFGDLFKYYTICYIYSAFRFHQAMNLNTWNSLPPDIQKIVEEVSDGYAAKMGENFDAMHEQGYQRAIEAGIEFIRLTPEESKRWEEKWTPLRSKWVANMNAKGMPGQQYLDVVVELLTKYNTQYPDPIVNRIK